MISIQFTFLLTHLACSGGGGGGGGGSSVGTSDWRLVELNGEAMGDRVPVEPFRLSGSEYEGYEDRDYEYGEFWLLESDDGLVFEHYLEYCLSDGHGYDLFTIASASLEQNGNGSDWSFDLSLDGYRYDCVENASQLFCHGSDRSMLFRSDVFDPDVDELLVVECVGDES